MYVTLVSCIIVCFEDISPPIRLTTGLGFGYLTILGHLISTAHWPHYCILLRILGQCFDWLLSVHLVYLIMLSFVNMFYFYDHQLCAGVITCVAVHIVHRSFINLAQKYGLFHFSVTVLSDFAVFCTFLLSLGFGLSLWF